MQNAAPLFRLEDLLQGKGRLPAPAAFELNPAAAAMDHARLQLVPAAEQVELSERSAARTPASQPDALTLTPTELQPRSLNLAHQPRAPIATPTPTRTDAHGTLLKPPDPAYRTSPSTKPIDQAHRPNQPTKPIDQPQLIVVAVRTSGSAAPCLALTLALALTQVLHLWDRIIGFDDLELLPVLAAAIFVYRARWLPQAMSWRMSSASSQTPPAARRPRPALLDRAGEAGRARVEP